jgi:hypothetical protein
VRAGNCGRQQQPLWKAGALGPARSSNRRQRQAEGSGGCCRGLPQVVLRCATIGGTSSFSFPARKGAG